MKRYENVDILRGVAILIIIVYHCYAITGPSLTQFCHVDKIIGYGGEVGVTLFFVLSGFGIEYSILQKERKEKYTWKSFMRKRMFRIVPQYFVSLMIMLLLTDCASFIGTKTGLVHILTHFTFTHNLLTATHGSINGAMWTLATIVQFYCIALLLHKAIKKNRMIALLGSVVVTIILKMFVFHIITNYFPSNGVNYFVYGRQLFTALDNFMIGMVIGNVCANKEVRAKWYNWMVVLGIMVITIAMILWIDQRGLYTDTWWGWSWHSVLALLMGGLIYFFVKCPPFVKGVREIFLFVSKIEYGMYIWHIVLIYNLVARSSIVKLVCEKSFALFCVCIIIVTIFAGYLSTYIIDKKDEFRGGK